jgi:hypothetical protein
MVEPKLIEQKRRVSALLEQVAEGRMEPEAALKLTEQWNDIFWRSSVFAEAYHALQHFSADVDIRSRDNEYANSQLSLLRSIARRLLADA